MAENMQQDRDSSTAAAEQTQCSDDVKIYAWLRRHNEPIFELPKPFHASAAILNTWPDYQWMRDQLFFVAQKQEPFAYLSNHRCERDAWLCPIDSDDWHAPVVKEVLASQPDYVDFVWWDIAAIRWVRPAHYTERWTHHGRLVPGTCGYAFRYELKNYYPRKDIELLRDDHVYAPIHALRMGLNMKYVPVVGGVWNVTPSSITIVDEFGTLPPWPGKDEYRAVLDAAIPNWLRPGVEATAELLRLYGSRLRDMQKKGMCRNDQRPISNPSVRTS